jgi:hypothetical protein
VLESLAVGGSGLFSLAGVLGGPYTASIYAFSGTGLIGPSLFSQSLGSSFAGFTLTPNLPLIGGSTYAVVVSPSLFTGVGSTGDLYAGGSALLCTAGTCNALFATRDVVGFAVGFVPTSVVPEPATLVAPRHGPPHPRWHRAAPPGYRDCVTTWRRVDRVVGASTPRTRGSERPPYASGARRRDARCRDIVCTPGAPAHLLPGPRFTPEERRLETLEARPQGGVLVA